MPIPQILFVALLSTTLALPQSTTGAAGVSSYPRTALPITFTKTVSADRARVGDAIYAKTTQAARLTSGELIPTGTEVVGHVTVATPFVYDKTPYAAQKESVLDIQFDSLHVAGHEVPLKVTVRAMADPLTSWGAREPKSSDLDSLATVTQIGGDELTPSQAEIVNRNGDVVAYNRRNGVFAHLIAHANCDGSTNEVSMDIYSASACGLYGFTDVSAREIGSTASPSRLSLISTHTSPKIWRHSTALLEMLPDTGVAR
jgi:hypothetical protein